MKTLDKYYDHEAVEAGKFDKWRESGFFRSDVNSAKPPFSVIVPPPNVTGILHIGHAKNTITIDTICRYKKLRGYDVLFAPCTDHAGIATQAKVEALLRERGLDKYEMGREAFLKEVWDFKEKSADYIHQQWRQMGIGMDYDREGFTLDERTTRAVNTTFKALFDQGLIYQGERIINWDTELNTALSNIEVEHLDIPGRFYYFKYWLADRSDYLTVATTRPETMFGDTAVVYNPRDERYRRLEGQSVINPANGEKIPLVADRYVDREFGTGVMKCTPAHDPHDFEIGKRHQLAVVRCIGFDGRMTERAGEYSGLDRFECRERLVERITAAGDLVKIEDIVHSVGHSERSHSIVEPMLSKQWFVRMKPLTERVQKLMRESGRMKFFPARFEKTFMRWLSQTDDWCISRQLWWGHRIPIYTEIATGRVVCSSEPLPAESYRQEEDVLDTWFSSALLPFALLGWPDTEDPYFRRYFPNSIMITAYDIIFFWVARMTFQSAALTGQLPFKDVFIHGLVRDEKGRKMSKSLGNGVDPIEVIDKFGTDTLRFVCATEGTPGLDASIGMANYEQARSFLNKIWSAARYVLSLLPDGFAPRPLENRELGFTDLYIYHRYDEAIREIARNMDKYELGQATRYLCDFVYDDYCGSYLEFTKAELKTADDARRDVIFNVLLDLLRRIAIALFPTCPYIAEEIYRYLPGSSDSIYRESFPTRCGFRGDHRLGAQLLEMIRTVRAFKAENGLAPNAPLALSLSGESRKIGRLAPLLKHFAFAERLTVVDPSPDQRFFGDIGLSIEWADSAEQAKRIAERTAFLEAEIARSRSILANPGFRAKAPREKVAAEEAKLAAREEELQRYRR